MKLITAILFLVTTSAVLCIPMRMGASEQVGIFALVERVVLEPNEQAPQRVQLWGVFATNRSTANPQKGYMYFTLPATQQQTALREWADFKSTAGSGKVLGFGMSFFAGQSATMADTYHASLGRIRPATEKPASPDAYPLNFGISPVSNPTIVESLKKALK